MATVDEVNAFIIGYEECAVWSSTHTPLEPDGTEGEPVEIDSLDWVEGAYTVAELFTPEASASIRQDCEGFIANAAEDLLAAFEAKPGYDWSGAGHDFWLTRNGHGAGFWDRGLGEAGDRLTAMAKSFGGLDLLVLEETHQIEVMG